MNNDLEQFSEERLKDIIELADNPTMVSLARIALTAKQAKAIGYVESKTTGTDRFIIKGFYAQNINIGDSIYTTPQPAHTEQVITDNVRDALEKALNAMQFMGDTLNNLDAVCAEDVEHVTPAFEAIRKLLAAAPQPANTEQVIPDGWKLVPIEPTEEMLISGLEEANPLGGLFDWDSSKGECNTRDQLNGIFTAMLAAAPKPESEL